MPQAQPSLSSPCLKPMPQAQPILKPMPQARASSPAHPQAHASRPTIIINTPIVIIINTLSRGVLIIMIRGVLFIKGFRVGVRGPRGPLGPIWAHGDPKARRGVAKLEELQIRGVAN